jgi:hypothetical protein
LRRTVNSGKHLDWMDKGLTSTHDLSVWSSSSLGRWHPRSSVVPLVLTRHSLPILNERWTCVINLSMFFYYVMVFLLFRGHEPWDTPHFWGSTQTFYVVFVPARQKCGVCVIAGGVQAVKNRLQHGPCPCIGFFLRRFNAADALICYSGSIEKLKLLGAT